MFYAIFSVNDQEFFGQVFLNFHYYRWQRQRRRTNSERQSLDFELSKSCKHVPSPLLTRMSCWIWGLPGISFFRYTSASLHSKKDVRLESTICNFPALVPTIQLSTYRSRCPAVSTSNPWIHMCGTVFELHSRKPRWQVILWENAHY